MTPTEAPAAAVGLIADASGSGAAGGDGRAAARASADWLCYLPLAAHARALVVSETPEGICAGLANASVSVRVLAAAELVARSSPANGPGPARAFDLVAAPAGFGSDRPERLRAGDARLAAVGRVLRPGGTLLLGFANRWYPAPRRRAATTRATVGSVTSALRAQGYTELRFLGVLPDGTAPAYVLPLRRQALAFVAGHLCGRPAVARLLGHPAVPADLLLHALPYYFAIATLGAPCPTRSPNA